MDDKLKFNEEVMLALYLEVFKEYYNKAMEWAAEIVRRIGG